MTGLKALGLCFKSIKMPVCDSHQAMKKANQLVAGYPTDPCIRSNLNMDVKHLLLPA